MGHAFRNSMPRGRKNSGKLYTGQIKKYCTRSTKKGHFNSGMDSATAETNMADPARVHAVSETDGDKSNAEPGQQPGNADTSATSKTVSESVMTESKSSQRSENSDLQLMEKRLMTVLTSLESKVDNISKNTEEMRKDFDEKLKNMGKEMKGHIEGLEQSVNYAHKTLEEEKGKVVQLEKESRRLKERLDNTQRMNKDLKKELDEFRVSMAEKLNDAERRSREYNIRLKGVPVQRVVDHDVKGVVADIVRDYF